MSFFHLGALCNGSWLLPFFGPHPRSPRAFTAICRRRMGLRCREKIKTTAKQRECGGITRTRARPTVDTVTVPAVFARRREVEAVQVRAKGGARDVHGTALCIVNLE